MDNPSRQEYTAPFELTKLGVYNDNYGGYTVRAIALKNDVRSTISEERFILVESEINISPIQGGLASVTTNPGDKAFLGDTVTVTVADVEEGKQIQSITVTDGDSNSIAVTTITDGQQYSFTMPAKAVTVSVIIGEILPSPVTVSYMEVKTPPTKVTYTEGEALDLMGLELRLTKSDATTEDVGFADFGAKGITVSPANGTVLTTDNTELIITADGKITTQAITVNQDVSQDQSWSDFSISGATSFSQGLADDTAIIAISNVKKNDANTVDAADTVLTGNLVIKINGQIVDADHYTVDDEADTITLWQAYLNTLTEGSHQFTVEYTDTANNVSQ